MQTGSTKKGCLDRLHLGRTWAASCTTKTSPHSFSCTQFTQMQEGMVRVRTKSAHPRKAFMMGRLRLLGVPQYKKRRQASLGSSLGSWPYRCPLMSSLLGFSGPLAWPGWSSPALTRLLRSSILLFLQLPSWPLWDSSLQPPLTISPPAGQTTFGQVVPSARSAFCLQLPDPPPTPLQMEAQNRQGGHILCFTVGYLGVSSQVYSPPYPDSLLHGAGAELRLPVRVRCGWNSPTFPTQNICAHP